MGPSATWDLNAQGRHQAFEATGPIQYLDAEPTSSKGSKNLEQTWRGAHSASSHQVAAIPRDSHSRAMLCTATCLIMLIEMVVGSSSKGQWSWSTVKPLRPPCVTGTPSICKKTDGAIRPRLRECHARVGQGSGLQGCPNACVKSR